MENEQQINPHKIENFSSPHIEMQGRESVFIDSKILGTEKWGQIIQETKIDSKERGMMVSIRGEKTYISDIFTGLSEKQDGGNNAEIFTPLFPHGLKSLLPGMKDVLFVHSHPMPKELDHIQTTIFSDADIANFINCEDRASVMIDRGGAHILVRTGETYNSRELVNKRIVENTQEETVRKEGKIIDTIKAVSKELSQYGIGYLYTPNLTPDPKGYVEFFDPNKIPEEKK